MNGAPNAAPAPIAEPAAPPPAPVAIAPVDPLTFTDDMPEFPPAVREALATPVDPSWCELRRASEKSDRELLYVPWIHYAAVLNKAFGLGGYRMVPRSVPRTEGNTITWTFALFVRIPGTTKFNFISESKGECGTHGGMTAGNAAEGAKSDALTKCCKALNIFAELFDPNWRRAWEKNAKGSRKQEQARAAWPAGRAPAQSAPAPVAATASTPPAPSSTGDGAAPAAAPADTGEAATAEAKQAIADRLKVLAWKWGFLREWVASHFGIKVDKPARMLEALTQVQADAMLALLLAFNQPAVYQRLVGELRERGVVLR